MCAAAALCEWPSRLCHCRPSRRPLIDARSHRRCGAPISAVVHPSPLPSPLRSPSPSPSPSPPSAVLFRALAATAAATVAATAADAAAAAEPGEGVGVADAPCRLCSVARKPSSARRRTASPGGRCTPALPPPILLCAACITLTGVGRSVHLLTESRRRPRRTTPATPFPVSVPGWSLWHPTPATPSPLPPHHSGHKYLHHIRSPQQVLRDQLCSWQLVTMLSGNALEISDLPLTLQQTPLWSCNWSEENQLWSRGLI